MSKNIDILMDAIANINTSEDPRIQSSPNHRNQTRTERYYDPSVDSINRPRNKRVACWGRRKEPLNDVQ